MTKLNHEISDSQLEDILTEAAGDFPDDGILLDITPWKKSMERILVGIGLQAITLNFLLLDIILPTIGMILLLLGFRALRKENAWFGLGFWVCVIRTVCLIVNLILDATIIPSLYLRGDPEYYLAITIMALVLLQSICLWRGLIGVRKKSGTPVSTGSAAALIVLQLIVSFLAIMETTSWIASIGVIVAYICIIRSLYNLSKSLDEAGYSIKAATSRLSEGNLVLALVIIIAVGIIGGKAFGSKYPMEWTEFESAAGTSSAVDSNGQQLNLTNIKQNLLSLGFPENVLNDLSNEDLLACEGAVSVVYDEPSEEEFSEYNPATLTIQGVAVQLSDDKSEWIIFHHFVWNANPGFYGTDSLQLWPTDMNNEDWTLEDGSHMAASDFDGSEDSGATSGSLCPFSGQVLYDKNGVTYASDYYSIGQETYFADSFWGKDQVTDSFATFSMPRGADNYRGYICYKATTTYTDPVFVNSWVNYTHQMFFLTYPVKTSKEARQEESNYLFSDDRYYSTVQDALQFDLSDEALAVYGN